LKILNGFGNKYFSLSSIQAHLAVRLFKYIPRCPFYCTFFAFRRTGVHPPRMSLFTYQSK